MGCWFQCEDAGGWPVRSCLRTSSSADRSSLARHAAPSLTRARLSFRAGTAIGAHGSASGNTSRSLRHASYTMQPVTTGTRHNPSLQKTFASASRHAGGYDSESPERTPSPITLGQMMYKHGKLARNRYCVPRITSPFSLKQAVALFRQMRNSSPNETIKISLRLSTLLDEIIPTMSGGILSHLHAARVPERHQLEPGFAQLDHR